MVVALVAQAMQPGLSPLLKDFLLSIISGRVVLVAVVAISNFDPVHDLLNRAHLFNPYTISQGGMQVHALEKNHSRRGGMYLDRRLLPFLDGAAAMGEAIDQHGIETAELTHEGCGNLALAPKDAARLPRIEKQDKDGRGEEEKNGRG